MNTPFKLIPTSLTLLLALGACWAMPAGAQAPGLPALSAPATPDTPDVDRNSYLLAPFDQLEISVVNQPDLHQTVDILQDGTFNYPVVGTVQAAGLTQKQLETLLTKGLSERYNQPQVTVMIRQTHTRKISVSGAVRSPGLYEYRPGLRLLDVISAAGGPSGANEQTQLNLITDKGTKSTTIDLVALINNGDQTQNPTLQPGDSLLFSAKDPAKSTIHVVGQVNKPGDYGVVNNGATVLAMLTEAGGATSAAALTHTQILRGATGKVETIDLHPLKYNLDDPAGRIKLSAGDTLLVPENNNKYSVLGEVRAPQMYYIPDGEPMPLTQALAEAGGPTNEGDKKIVALIRKGPQGQRIATKYNVQDLLKGDATVQNPDLQPGDILVVPTRHIGTNVLGALGQVTGLAYTFRVLGYR